MTGVTRVSLPFALLIFFFSTTFATDEMTQYELLASETHQFKIRYDVSATLPGSTVFFNIIRPGSEASDERVFDRSNGKELQFVLTNGKEAKAAGQAESDTADDTGFIKVKLPHAVPENGEYRLRIYKTYKDAKSYSFEKNQIVFERNLGVKRNSVILPLNYEVVFSSVPVIVNREADGRVKLSMVNDRDDELEVKIIGRKVPEENE